MKEWMKNKAKFEVIDVREVTNSFLPGILKKAQNLEEGKGICVIQTFKPKPLNFSMEDMGYEYEIEKVGEHEYRTYYFRRVNKSMTFEGGGDMPFKPTAILNYKNIDLDLAEVVVDFWELTWEKENAAIKLKDKLLFSFCNAEGAGRHRQATRELINAYSLGVNTDVMDELFELIAWNQGIGAFSSEVGPSPEFKVYKLIKQRQKQGKNRKEILEEVKANFGEKNAQVEV